MTNHDRDLAIIAGWRTPFCKASGSLAGASAADLATHVFREVLDRTGIDPDAIDEVILGCAGPDAAEANVARVAALRAGLPKEIPAVTVMRNCASGMEALLAAQQRLRAGDGEVFLVGGAESMSNFPLLMGKRLVKFFTGLQKARMTAVFIVLYSISQVDQLKFAAFAEGLSTSFGAPTSMPPGRPMSA